MNKKRYLLPETIVHEIEIQSVLQVVSIEKKDTPQGDPEDDAVDDSDKSKGFNINLWN